jgi:photosystem II stability/assembly factor-like uncharacterized protein
MREAWWLVGDPQAQGACLALEGEGGSALMSTQDGTCWAWTSDVVSVPALGIIKINSQDKRWMILGLWILPMLDPPQEGAQL